MKNTIEEKPSKATVVLMPSFSYWAKYNGIKIGYAANCQGECVSTSTLAHQITLLTKLNLTAGSKRRLSVTDTRFGSDCSLRGRESGEIVKGRHKTCKPHCVVMSWQNGRASDAAMSSLLSDILDKKSCANPGRL